MSDSSPTAPRFVITWVPFSIAVVSFVISIYTFFITSRPAQVEVILPQHIRIAQGEEFGYAYAYFQPTIVSTGRSQQVEVVRDLTLDFAPVRGGDEASLFEWRESGRIAYDPATRQTTYEYQSDAAPLLLTRETAQSPLGTFYGPPGWYFTPGEWQGTLTAQLANNRPPVQSSFRFTLTEEEIATVNAGGGRVYVSLDIDEQR